jgi:hypothetical protein
MMAKNGEIMAKSWRNSHHLLGACFGAQIEVLQEPIALLERATRK